MSRLNELKKQYCNDVSKIINEYCMPRKEQIEKKWKLVGKDATLWSKESILANARKSKEIGKRIISLEIKLSEKYGKFCIFESNPRYTDEGQVYDQEYKVVIHEFEELTEGWFNYMYYNNLYLLDREKRIKDKTFWPYFLANYKNFYI
jgi:hypothetical protein